MEEPDSPLTKMQISMARMEGMLTQALADHSARLVSNENALNVERNRITTVENIVGQHTVILANHENDTKAVIEKLNNGMPRTILVITGVTAAGSMILSLIMFFMNGIT